LGAVSTQFPGGGAAVAAGAVAGSFAFFFALGHGAAWLRPVFARPSAWRVLEGAIALTMWAIALELAIGG
jgi:L-lysine exporter family protein LysE/ArgO